MPAADNKANIYIGPPLRAALDAVPAGNRSGRINDLAERYMEVVRRSTPTLSLGEWCALCELLNSTARDSQLARVLHIEVEDGMADGIADKWEIDGAALTARVTAMTLAERMAVVEIADRYWATHDRHPSHEAALDAAGARIRAPADASVPAAPGSP